MSILESIGVNRAAECEYIRIHRREYVAVAECECTRVPECMLEWLNVC